VRRPNHNGPIIDRDACLRLSPRAQRPTRPRPWPLSRGWTTAPPAARSPSDGPGSPTVKMGMTGTGKKERERERGAARTHARPRRGAVAPRTRGSPAAAPPPALLFSWAGETERRGRTTTAPPLVPARSRPARRKVRHARPWPAKRDASSSPLNRLLLLITPHHRR
jgi:hypothetical protein